MSNERNSVPRCLFNTFENGFSLLICEQQAFAGAAANIKTVNAVFNIKLNEVLD